LEIWNRIVFDKAKLDELEIFIIV